MGDWVYIMRVSQHNRLVSAAFRTRGFDSEEAQAAARLCQLAAWHGIKTHNAIKALHLDASFGSMAGGCRPGAELVQLESRFKAVERWNANRKLGQATAFAAMDRCMALADEYGVGVVSVDNAFHYLWGGGYVIDAANKGYIAYTCCTAALAEVVPFRGRYPTLGTNPHSWGFPTQELLGYPICVDWATSTVAMGRVQQFGREGRPLPADAAVDEHGLATTDPGKVKALLPFGGHKGYGLSLVNELMAAYGGGSLPTVRSRWSGGDPAEKHTPNFFFQCIRPDALTGSDYAFGRSQQANVQAVIEDILGHGNEGCLLPGQLEAHNAALSARHGGLLFTPAELDAFVAIAEEGGQPFDPAELKRVDLS